MATRASFAADRILKRNILTDLMVSTDMVYGVVHVGDEWWHVSIRKSDPDEVDALFPDARDRTLKD